MCIRDRYQAFCEAKKDARFDRSEKTLEKLDDGPYYAISIYPGSCLLYTSRCV